MKGRFPRLPSLLALVLLAVFGAAIPPSAACQPTAGLAPVFEASVGSTYARWADNEPHSTDRPSYALSGGLRARVTPKFSAVVLGGFHSEKLQFAAQSTRYQHRSARNQVGMGGLALFHPARWLLGVGVEHRWPVSVQQEIYSLGPRGREWIKEEVSRPLESPSFAWIGRVGYDFRYFAIVGDVVSAGADAFPFVGGTSGLVYSNFRLGLHLPIQL